MLILFHQQISMGPTPARIYICLDHSATVARGAHKIYSALYSRCRCELLQELGVRIWNHINHLLKVFGCFARIIEETDQVRGHCFYSSSKWVMMAANSHSKNPAPVNVGRVLIVDDIVENIQVLGTVLKNAGYAVLVGRSGEDALRIAANAGPDLILLDIMMPIMDGYEACQQLQSNPSTAHIPIIFLTALSDVEDELKGLSLGAVDYITKPFNSNLVLSRVSRHIQIAKSRLSDESNLTEAQVAELIKGGENSSVEFKSTIRWNLRTDKSDKVVELAWAKAAVAFINSEGGTVLVGVNDEGEVSGLESDRFKNSDKLMLHVNNVIKTHIGMEHAESIQIDIIEVGGKDVLIVRCTSSKNPAFLVSQEGEDFYVRLGPSSRKLTTRAAIEYLETRRSRSPK